MKTGLPLVLLTLLSLSAAQAQPAGRVLALAGDATLSRAGQQLPLRAGAMVESGDVLAVGERSALQVRFTDESVVALRANSQFRIEDYRFDNNAEQDRSVMGLLKGGMRTITGLIGKANQKNYMVRTATSTIGIRGTHFTVVSCSNDCRNADGTPVPNGTFGGVTDGRVTVSNSSGQQEFGQQDYFHVPSADSAPVRLLAPPAILNDRSSGARGRSAAAAPATGSSGTAAGGETAAESNSGTQTSTSPQLTVLAAPTTQLTAPLTLVVAAEQPAIASNATNARISVIEIDPNSNFSCSFACIKTNAQSFTLAELKLEITDSNIPKLFTDAASLAAELRAATAPAPSDPLFTLVGSSAAAAAYWGYSPPRSSDASRLGNHVAFGDSPTVALPGSGTAQYNYVGGTVPTDNFGRVGNFSGGNALLMDFGARQIKPMANLTLSFGTNAQQSTPTVYVLPAYATFSMNPGAQVWTGATCTSGCVGTTTGTVNGIFTGASAQGFISAVTVTNTQLNTSKPNAAGAVAVFARQ
ncbi:MAG TPA: FecR family protein [Polaromonas sp.]|uniref:FecR family protein n=1 Tax=Polaromonas sp. TaxID=1869339 RepID=UPI002D51EBCB|nr:FecR family protein [Polaromonas sp.]HYW55588.1 FecR family protein [Polaromonas sp.]